MNFCVEYAKLQGVGKKKRRQQLMRTEKKRGQTALGAKKKRGYFTYLLNKVSLSTKSKAINRANAQSTRADPG